MVDFRTEQIRCILCNKQLNLDMNDNKGLVICAICQAYFCSSCLGEISAYRQCPAAQLLGLKSHKLRLLKILPPKKILKKQQTTPLNAKTRVRILPKKKARVIGNGEENTKKKKGKNS